MKADDSLSADSGKVSDLTAHRLLREQAYNEAECHVVLQDFLARSDMPAMRGVLAVVDTGGKPSVYLAGSFARDRAAAADALLRAYVNLAGDKHTLAAT
jgi:hypothetical protein